MNFKGYLSNTVEYYLIYYWRDQNSNYIIDFLLHILLFLYKLLSLCRVFDIHEKKKIDINELQSVRPESQVLEKMQHSKWATSNHLFDYNAFINDFYR